MEDKDKNKSVDLSQERIKDKILAQFPQLQRLEALKREERLNFFREVARIIEDEFSHI